MALTPRVLRVCAIVALCCLFLSVSLGTIFAQDDAPVAFVGADGNIWMAQPDGSDQRLVAQVGVELGDARLVVSPDGSMVAQAQLNVPVRIWHLDDGSLVEIPGSERCAAPAFSADSQRLLYTCGPVLNDLGADPPGLVLSSAVDGSNPRVEVPLPVGIAGEVLDVRLADGAILTSEWRDMDEGQGSLPHTVLYDAQLNELGAFEGTEVQEWGRQMPFDARFSPDGEAIVARVCETGCIHNQETVARDFLIGFDGIIIERITPQWLIDAGGSRMSIPATVGSGAVAGPATADAPVSAGELIAFIGVDGNVWLVNSDGSNPQRITDDANIPGYGRYANPSWSHDGTMLAFEGPAPGSVSAIYVWTVGEPGRVEIEATEHCANPVFSGDNLRVLYQCHRSHSGPPVSPLDPRNGEIVSSAIEGTDQRIEVAIDPAAVQLTLAAGMDVRSSDGAVMVWSFDPYGIPRAADVRIYDAAYNQISSATLPIGTNVDPAAVGPIGLAFSPDGEGFVALVCTATCIETGTAEAFAGVVTDLDGNVVERWQPDAPLDPSILYYLTGIDMSPDGNRMVASYAELHGVIGTFDVSGVWTPIAEGHSAAWQPVPAETPDVAGPGDSGTTEAAGTEVVAAPAGLEAGPGWIAYVSNGIRLVRPDLSEVVTLVEMDGGSNLNPVWSHDGTMLAWNGPTWPDPAFLPHRGIWVFANGQVTQLPGTDLCSQPAFSSDNTRILYVCAGPEHQERPVEAIIPEHLVGVPATGVYIPNNTWLGSISSSALDGSDQRVELAYDGSGDTAWGGLSGPMMVYTFEVRSTDGALIVTYRDPMAPPTVAGTLVLDAHLSPISNTPLAGGDIFPLMLPDGTIVTPRGCENLCPNGMPVTLTGLDGTEIDAPVAAQLVGPAWTFDLSPDASFGVAWTYHDGVWIQGADENRILIDPSGMYPVWQPVPVEIPLPQ